MVVIMYCRVMCLFCFFFFKQKTAYEMRISDWSSDVCSSDLDARARRITPAMLIAAVQALASIPTSDDTLLPSPFDPRLDPALSPAVAEAARLDPGEADGSLSPTRCERDPLGDVDVPVERLFGAQTQRAVKDRQSTRL